MSNDKTELPNPIDLPAVGQGVEVDAVQDTLQQNTINPESLSSAQTKEVQHQPSSQQPINPVVAQPSNQQVNGATNQSTAIVTNSPAIADDVDLIEKEWVQKAKEIVNKTQDNPYLQNKAISEIKADYIKKRYSKEVSTKSE